MEHLELVNDMYTRVNKNFNKDRTGDYDNETLDYFSSKKTKNTDLYFLLYYNIY